MSVFRLQVNMEVDEQLYKMQETLCNQNEHTFSQLVRWLIRQEYARRFSCPQPLVTIDEAVAASQVE